MTTQHPLRRLPGLDADEDYQVQVRATNAVGSSPNSPNRAFSTLTADVGIEAAGLTLGTIAVSEPAVDIESSNIALEANALAVGTVTLGAVTVDVETLNVPIAAGGLALGDIVINEPTVDIADDHVLLAGVTIALGDITVSEPQVGMDTPDNIEVAWRDHRTRHDRGRQQRDAHDRRRAAHCRLSRPWVDADNASAARQRRWPSGARRRQLLRWVRSPSASLP